MAKLRPLSDEKEIAAVPVEEPVLVELPAAPSGLADEGGDTPAVTQVKPKAAAKDDADDGVEALRAQLTASEAARKAFEDRAERAERERSDALRVAREREQDAERYRTGQEQAEHDSLASSLQSAQSERDAAKIEYAKAFETGDASAIAEANDKMSRANSKITYFEAAVADADQQRKTVPAKKVETPANVNDAIDSNPALLPREREYLKSHPELVMDQSLNSELGVAHNRALRAGNSRGSEGYFAFVDEFMGYKKAAVAKKPDDEDDTTMVSAPVSRDNISNSTGRPSTSRITLSPEQREFARTLGITDTQYAKRLLQLQQEKSAYPEKYAGRA